MRMEDIRSQNEKYYCCEDYIWYIKNASRWLSSIYIIAMGWVLWWINRLLLKKQLLIQAASQELGYEDVMHWVDTRLESSYFDIITIMIIVFTVAILLFIWVRIYVKSYNLYKKWRYRILRALPVLFCLLELIAICLYYSSIIRLTEICLLLICLAPNLFSSRLLYPLESRPGGEGNYEKLKLIFDFLAKFIIERI